MHLYLSWLKILLMSRFIRYYRIKAYGEHNIGDGSAPKGAERKMKVYIIQEPYENKIYGVFNLREKAESKIEEMDKEWGCKRDLYVDEYEVEE